MCMRHRRERFECERHARERVCIGRPHFVCARRATTIPWRRAGRQDSEGQEHRKPLRRARDGQPNRQRRCVQHRLALPPAARQGKHLVKYTAFSWNLPSSCSRVAGHFHMWEHDYLLGNSCRGNSLRSRGGAVAAFSRLSTTRLPEAAATQRRSSCRLQHIGRYPRGSGARTVVARLPLARLRVGPGEGRLAAPLLAASRAPGAPTRFWRRALKVPLASPVGPGEVLRAHPRGTTPPASPSPQRQPVSVRPCFDPGQDSHIIQRSENHQ